MMVEAELDLDKGNLDLDMGSQGRDKDSQGLLVEMVVA
jgi:hypothetical protein